MAAVISEPPTWLGLWARNGDTWSSSAIFLRDFFRLSLDLCLLHTSKAILLSEVSLRQSPASSGTITPSGFVSEAAKALPLWPERFSLYFRLWYLSHSLWSGSQPS